MRTVSRAWLMLASPGDDATTLTLSEGGSLLWTDCIWSYRYDFVLVPSHLLLSIILCFSNLSATLLDVSPMSIAFLHRSSSPAHVILYTISRDLQLTRQPVWKQSLSYLGPKLLNEIFKTSSIQVKLKKCTENIFFSDTRYIYSMRRKFQLYLIPDFFCLSFWFLLFLLCITSFLLGIPASPSLPLLIFLSGLK